MPRPTVTLRLGAPQDGHCASHAHVGAMARNGFFSLSRYKSDTNPKSGTCLYARRALDQGSDLQIGAHVRKWKLRSISSKRCSKQAWTHCSMPGRVSAVTAGCWDVLYLPVGDPAGLRTGQNGSVGEIALLKTRLGILLGS